jgi:tRNA (Thr-GGU) A37 N-methylase
MTASLCKIVSVKDNVVEVEKIDAFEGTPVLNSKPYAPGRDSATGVKVPEWPRTRRNGGIKRNGGRSDGRSFG